MKGSYDCSLAGLRDLARDILLPKGIGILYGFYKAPGIGYSTVVNSTIQGEAVNLDGDHQKVLDQFKSYGPVQKAKRVMSNGRFNMKIGFGNCAGAGICTELRKAAKSKEYQRVFGWTVYKDSDKQIGQAIGTANVDGLIYGYRGSAYADDQAARDIFKSVAGYVKAHPDQVHVATKSEPAW